MPGTENDESPRAFLSRVGNALLRIIALAVVGAAHWALEKGLTYVIPENFKSEATLIEDVSFLFFLLIYLYLLWDMLKVFIPWLQSKPYPGTPTRRRR
jgi:hypothetical protein